MTAVDIPAGSPFGLDNLPYGVFSTPGTAPRVGVRVGDRVLDLAALFEDLEIPDPALSADSLGPFMAQGPARWAEVRDRLQDELAGHSRRGEFGQFLHTLDRVHLHLPFRVGDYVDFYANEHHARNLGAILRPGSAALHPNWKYLPVGYHGRAGTVVVSGTEVVRPSGQRRGIETDMPTFGPSQRLDIEAEVGFVVGVPSRRGVPIPLGDFDAHVFGAVLVDDWSARDIQAWEYVPLGPFLGKSFATSISAWVVPMGALEHARIAQPPQDPEPLPYLRGDRAWGLDLAIEVSWNGQVVSRPPYAQMYWSPAQMLAHLTVGGASVRTGDLFASGTVSGAERSQCGSLIELTWGGTEPVTVGGRPSTFLEDGDEVVIAATAPGPGDARIGFGEVRGRVIGRPETAG
ncbi:fumarylacetoacetase [Speluncibacter jeojiensis]|uniref:fumarylacetoacetase n=1 Tax=Speluncibacter jeojiensis TaxID=2710754 RepID=A0A9X4RDI0_9ACTN|nr:fumarylacetoacetase [Corynebacteriales bacterium D3-21]